MFRSNHPWIKLTLLSLLLVGSGNQAQAEPSQFPRGVSAKIRRFVQDNQLSFFINQGKLHFGVSHDQDYMQGYARLGSNMVEFLVDAGQAHLYTRVGQTVYDRTGTWARLGSLNVAPWTPNYAHKRIGVLVELKPKQMQRLEAYLAAAHDNPTEVMGEWNYDGGKPPRKSNCTSFIVRTPIGDKGEHVHEVCGVPFLAKGLEKDYSPLGHPQSWINSLILSKKACVRAVVIHNHEGELGPQAVDLSY